MAKLLTCGTIIRNEQLIPKMYRMDIIAPEIAKIASPGQFVHIRSLTSTNFLRRPFSIANADPENGIINIYYRVIGRGTAEYTLLHPQMKIDLLGPIGSHFNTENIPQYPLLIGGGVGIAPLIFLTRQLESKEPLILIGGKNKDEVFWRELFTPYTDKIYVTTDDGSVGTQGFTIDLLPQITTEYPIKQIYTCGPDIMMKHIANYAHEHSISCQVSLEKRMACGFGVCLACTCDNQKTKSRVKVCTDGPVFNSQEVY